MQVKVNGEARELSDGTTVAQLMDALKVVPERVVVELNMTILKRHEHGTRALKAGDTVEVVAFIGGGSSGERR